VGGSPARPLTPLYHIRYTLINILQDLSQSCHNLFVSNANITRPPPYLVGSFSMINLSSSSTIISHFGYSLISLIASLYARSKYGSLPISTLFLIILHIFPANATILLYGLYVLDRTPK